MIRLPGMYQKDGSIYKVQPSQSSGYLYAKKLVDLGDGQFKFDYDEAKAERIIGKLSAADMMTLAQAKEFGALFGVCCVCGRLLTNEASIEAGIGPICAENGGFANGSPTSLYQDSDEARQAEIKREATEQTHERTIKLGQNKYGPIFLIRFAYGDPQFAALKDEIKATTWEDTKRRWDNDLKAWTVDAKGEAGQKFVGQFAREHEFTVSDEAKDHIEYEAVKAVYDNPAVATTQEAVQQEIDRRTAGLPMTFAELAREV